MIKLILLRKETLDRKRIARINLRRRSTGCLRIGKLRHIPSRSHNRMPGLHRRLGGRKTNP